MQSLANQYRPRIFEDIVGQQAVSKLLQAMVTKDSVPQVLLFVGPYGSGKTSAARVLGAALNCEFSVNPPCGECSSCLDVFEGTSTDYREIDAATHGRVEEIRKLQEDILYQTPGKTHVVVLDEAHMCTSAASNALLKTLEEAPENVVFVLVSTEPDKIMTTIKSRCMTFQFRRIAPDTVARRLYEVNEREHLGVDPEVLVAIAERSQGALRDALMLLDQISRAHVTTMSEYASLFGNPDFAPSLVSAMIAGDYVKSFELLEAECSLTGDSSSVLSSVVRTFKDVLIIQGGGTTTLKASALKSRTEIARTVSSAKILSAMRVLWDLKIKMQISDDSLASLSLAVTSMVFALSDNPIPNSI